MEDSSDEHCYSTGWVFRNSLITNIYTGNDILVYNLFVQDQLFVLIPDTLPSANYSFLFRADILKFEPLMVVYAYVLGFKVLNYPPSSWSLREYLVVL